MPGNNLKLADQFASNYDTSILKNNWNGPELIYEKVKNLLTPDSSILDLGIGTGESSLRFYNDAYSITGLDGSKKMLDRCSKKLPAAKLVKHDLEIFPYPLKNSTFDIVLSNGVFHLIHPLKPVFPEVARILKPNGTFVFTYDHDDDLKNYNEVESGIYARISESGVNTFKYSENTILQYLNQNALKITDQFRFLAYTDPQTGINIHFTAIVSQL